MATIKWAGTTSTATNLGSNWLGGVRPTSVDDVVFDSTSNLRSCSVSTGETWKSLTITSGFTQTFTVGNSIAISGAVSYGTGSWSLAGTAIMTINASATIATNGRSIPHRFQFGVTTLSAAISIALSDAINCANDVSVFGSAFGVNFSGAFSISCVNLTANGASCTHVFSGDVNVSALSTFNGNPLTLNGGFAINTASATFNFVTSGSMAINVSGGTIQCASGGRIRMNMTLTAPLTIGPANPFRFDSATINASGSIVTTGSVLTIAATSTLNTGGVVWNDINISASAVVTNNSILSAAGTLTQSGNTTWAGSAGFTVATLSNLVAGNITSIAAGVTYTVSASATVTGTSALPCQIISGTPGVASRLVLATSAVQDFSFCSPVDIDSTLGQTIGSFKSTIPGSVLNWVNIATATPFTDVSIYG